MRISAAMIDAIVEHSREEAPNECCGLVGGTDGTARTLYRARNEFASPLRYNVHPQDLLRITGQIDDAGEELVGIYHSHTRSEAWPSQTDINLARNWPDPLYLICSVAEPEAPVVRAFALGDGSVREVALEIEGA